MQKDFRKKVLVDHSNEKMPAVSVTEYASQLKRIYEVSHALATTKDSSIHTRAHSESYH